MSGRKAHQKLEVIMKVRSGQMTVTEAARQAGISRKTYYEWEKKALMAIMEAFAEKPPGRKEKKQDPEKEALKKELESVKKEKILLENTMRIRELLSETPFPCPSNSTGGRTEKKRKKEKR